MSSFNRNQKSNGDVTSSQHSGHYGHSGRSGRSDNSDDSTHFGQHSQSGYNRYNTNGGRGGFSKRNQSYGPKVSSVNTGANTSSWRAGTRSGSVSDTSSISSVSSGASMSTVNSTSPSGPRRKTVSEQIEEWVKSPNTDEQLIEEYKLKESIFDSPNSKYQRDNFTNFVNNLSRYRRINLLKWYLGNKIPELIESIKKDLEEKKGEDITEESIENKFDTTDTIENRFLKNFLKASSPLNLVIYTKDNVFTSQTFEEIITIINILVDYGFGFISRKMRKDKTEYEETLFEALYYEKNPIPIEYKHMIFDYFMYEFDNENFWMDSYKSISNRIGGKFENVKSESKELIYFLGMKCTNTIVIEQFNSLLDRTISIDESAFETRSINIIQFWLGEQSFPNSIYNRYYQDERSGISTKAEQIVNLIITNGISIIEKKLSSYRYGNMDDADLIAFKAREKSGHYKNYLFVLGMFYSMGYYQTDILKILDSVLCGEDGDDFMMLVFTHFILGGKIDMNSMDSGLRQFVAKFINKIYNVTTGKKIQGFILFDTILTIKLLKLKGNSTEFFKNLANPDKVIKYTCKANPIITLIQTRPPLTSTIPIIQQVENFDDELVVRINQLKTSNDDFNLDDFNLGDFNLDDFDKKEETVDTVEIEENKEDDEDLSWLDEFEEVQMVEPDSELVDAFTRFVEHTELEDGIDYINNKLTKLSKFVLNEQMVIAIIMTLYSRQKPFHVMMLKKFISQTQSPDTLVSAINQLMSDKKIVDSIKNDHEFPQVEKYVGMLLSNY